MGFQPGHKFGKGRPRGSVSPISKIRRDFYATLEEANFDPAKELMDIYSKARSVFDNYALIYENLSRAKAESGDPFPVEDKADKYLKIALDAAKEIAGYCYPKLKSVELKTENPLEHLSRPEKIEELKKAILVLEAHGSPELCSPGSEKDK